MKNVFAIIFILSFFASAQIFADLVDTDVSSVESSTKSKNAKDYTFSGKYPFLQTVSLDEQYQSVNLLLAGDFPILQSVHLSTTSGAIKGKFAGHFSQLEEISAHSSSGELRLDFTGEWGNPCNIELATTSGGIYVKLPQGINVLVKTHTSSGRVQARSLVQIESRRGERVYSNSNDRSQSPVLTFDIETTSGRIVLN